MKNFAGPVARSLGPKGYPLSVIFLSLLTACGPALVGFDPKAGPEVPAPPKGLRYYVAKDVIAIQVDETITTKTDLVEKADTKEFKVTASTETSRVGTAAVKTIADTTQPFVIDLKPGGRSDNSLTVEVRENGLLKSVNAASTGRTGEAIVSLAKFAGTILGGFPLGGAAGEQTRCDAFAAPFLTQPKRVRALVASDAIACGLFHEVRDLEATVEGFEKDRLAIEKRIAAAQPKVLATDSRKLALLKDALDNTRKRLAEKQTTFTARLDQFVAAKGLGSKTEQKTLTDMLDLTELPEIGKVSETTKVDDIKSKVSDEAFAVFERTGAIVTVARLPTWVTATPIAEKNAPQKFARIYFRQGHPLRVKLFVLDKCGDEKCLKIVSDQVIDLIHPSTPAQHVEFDESSFAERKLLLVFDAKGRPEKLERSGTSEVAALSASLSSAATGLRDEFATTLTKVSEIQATRRTIELDDLTSELARLKKEKEVMDARIDVEGTALTFDSVVRQRQLAADLAALQADIALQTAQATAEQKVDIERLKAQVETLAKQLEIIQAELKIQQARNP